MNRKIRVHKKAFIVMLCFILSLISLSQAFAASSSLKSASTDIAGHWAENTLKTWQEQGLIKGYEDGSVRPNHQITRAEFAALVNKSFGYLNSTAISFKDMKTSDWFYEDIAKAVSAGYIKGYPNQSFKPNQPLTREEMASIISSLVGLKATASSDSFKDLAAGHEWSKDSIHAVAEAGLMVGDQQKFRPLATATRAEAITVLDRALTLQKNKETVVYNKAGSYGPQNGVATITGTVYIDAPDIVLNNTIINGDLYIREGVGKGDVSLKNVTVRGTTTITGGGKNSIHITDSVLVTVIVNKKDGSIRIVTEGNGSVQQITLQSGALLQQDGNNGGFANVNLSNLIPKGAEVSLAGKFETVDVFASSIRVNLLSGSVQNLQVASGASDNGIDLAAGTSVNRLTLNDASRVTGQGLIGTAVINASGSTIAQTPANVIRANNVSVAIGSPVNNSGGGTGNAGGNPGTENPGSVTDTVYGFEGYITDVDNQPVPDMTIHFRKGLGAMTGEIAGTVVTDSRGFYFAKLAPGIYTGELVKQGFITTYVVGVSLTDEKNVDQNATAIKIPAADEIRIVLTWGYQPLDEDSHLIGPRPDKGYFHTWYGDKQHHYNGELYADLDHDDVDSYGPETTTIRKRVDGTYTFYVHNYSGNGLENKNTLAASDAKVEIYNGNNATPVKTYHIPAGEGTERYWYVFDMTVNGSELGFVDKNELTHAKPKADLITENNPTSARPLADNVYAENNPGAQDVLRVRGLSAGDVVNLYLPASGEFLYSAPVPVGSDIAEFTHLDFGQASTTARVSITSPGATESSSLEVKVLSEADYAALGTTVASAFEDHSVPSTLTVGDAVYLADPLKSLPTALKVKVLSVTPVSSVTETVYLQNDPYSGVILAGYNGTNTPVQYKVQLELRHASSTVNAELILTLPTVFSALAQSVALADERLDQTNNESLFQARNAADQVLQDSNSAVTDYINALNNLNDVLNQL